MIKSLVLSIFFVCVSLSFYGQSSDIQAVESGVAALHKAMIDANRSSLEHLIAKGLSYGHSNGKIDNKEEFIEGIVSGKSKFTSINISNQTISIVDNVALVRHSFNAELETAGTNNSLKLAVLLIFKKEKRIWKLLARQAIKIP